MENWKQLSKEAVRETKKLILDLESQTSSLKQRCVKLIAERRRSDEAQKLMGDF